jgi:excisionase family DNA binding protein
MLHNLLGKVYTPKEFAGVLHLRTNTITVWIHRKKLKAFKLGGRFYIPTSERLRLKRDARKAFAIDRPAVKTASSL